MPTPWLVGGALLLLGGQTLAAPPGGYDAPSYVNYKRPKPERRAGFHVGVQAGWGLGVAQAYPNEAAKIGDPTFEQSTGAGLGNEFSLWLGAALRDWLTFGFGLSIESVRGNGLMGTNVGPIFKVETFPFYPMGGHWRDVGVALTGGLSIGSIVDPDDPSELLGGGVATSQVALTAFYEPFRFWAAATGPTVTYAHGFAQGFSHHQLLLGWRFAIYSAQPRKKKSPTEEAGLRRDSAASF